MCLAQGHNAVPSVRLEPTTIKPRVKHSTTEHPRTKYETRGNCTGFIFCILFYDCFACLFVLMLYVQVNNFSVISLG